MGSLVVWTGGGFVVVGILLLSSCARAKGLLCLARRVLAAVGVLLLGGLLLTGWFALRSFEVFSSRDVIAEVRCTPIGPSEYELSFVPIHRGRPQPAQTYRLSGNQWMLSGGIVTWHPWLTWLGLPSYHKPTRLSGRFQRAADERRHAPSLVELNGGLDPVWDWCYRHQRWLPFVEAAYGSAAYADADPTVRYRVMVSPSGYVIDRAG